VGIVWSLGVWFSRCGLLLYCFCSCLRGLCLVFLIFFVILVFSGGFVFFVLLLGGELFGFFGYCFLFMVGLGWLFFLFFVWCCLFLCEVYDCLLSF